MSDLTTLALVAMSATKDRSSIDPSMCWGHEREVEKIIADPKHGLKAMLWERHRLDWDGITPLWQFIIEAFMRDCMIERAHALFGDKCKEIETAYAYIQHYRILTNMDRDPGDDSMTHLKKAEDIVLGAVMIDPKEVQNELPMLEVE